MIAKITSDGSRLITVQNTILVNTNYLGSSIFF